MNKLIWRIVIAFVMVATLVGMAVPVSSAPKPIDYTPYDVGSKIRQWEATPDRISGDGEVTGSEVLTASPLAILDTKLFLSLDDYNGVYFFTTFDLVAQSGETEIWVQQNLSWPDGDTRSTPEITQEQVDYLLNEFDTNILPTENSFFGPADFHDGTYSLLEAWGYVPPGYYNNVDGRQIVLVSNIRDENYYDDTYKIYIAGFYSPTFEAYFDRNIISIDAYDWANRVGPDGSKPYLYEGIFAHEYQHLLHDDYDPDEENFINEGMSEFAEILCGYTPALQGHIDAAASNPENSLTVWEDQGDEEILTDYGQAALFQIYLWEQFGQEFTQALFHNQGNGIVGINETLTQMGLAMDFAELYHNFSIAMLINSTQAGGKFAIKTFPSFSLDIGDSTVPNPEAFYTPGAPPWGTDYIWLEGDYDDLDRLSFNGVDYSTNDSAWTSDGDVLWSGTGDMLDNWAIFEATGGGILSFDALWDLEDYWDFGFVQISTDGGYTWTSLVDNEGYSTYDHDPSAHPTVVANLPGLTSWITTWDTLTYDLSAYSGQDILIAFRMVTDWATYYGGWWIDNVYIDETLISDGSDVNIFMDITEVLPINNDFTVTFVGEKVSGKSKHEFKVLRMGFNSDTEDRLFELKQMFKWATSIVMLVTFDAPEGFTGYANYSYDWIPKTTGPKK